MIFPGETILPILSALFEALKKEDELSSFFCASNRALFEALKKEGQLSSFFCASNRALKRGALSATLSFPRGKLNSAVWSRD